MCLIVDANVFGDFFTSCDFENAKSWVLDGPGKLISGGTKYKGELASSEKMNRTLLELAKMGKLVTLSDKSVDLAEKKVAARKDLHSNDPHIIAMVMESCCKIVCTKDRNLQRDFGDKFRARFGVEKPRVFQRAGHAHLLCDASIVKVCL